ncbi:hypothetical protein LEP1GSC172_3710 [Leptospira noguchii]|uniref:Uncharacterized protein n=2 Tax=Leptospira noguchii TaxID=28182 RepID=T0FPW8_9LEPT|nr:hypothetical protein LEP1GSC172_3710 [Leptospira noguchii]EQA71625.1 hypothetical protein LEP1GSC059_2589 [Leptospira noguchii serovar Panama str. CZ214]
MDWKCREYFRILFVKKQLGLSSDIPRFQNQIQTVYKT